MWKMTAVAAALALVAGSAGDGSAQPAAAPAAPSGQTAACDLSIANHILFRHGVLDGAGHVSMRSPSRPDRFYLSRALAAASVTPADVIEFDLQGEPVTNQGDVRLYSERFIHAAVYRARPDVRAVVHSHSPESVTFSISSVPMRAVAHTAGFVGTKVPVFESNADGRNPNILVSDNAAGDRLAQALGQSEIVLIRGHGDVIVGPSLAGATTRALDGRKNARMLLDASRLGGDVKSLSESEVATLISGERKYNEFRAWNMLMAEEAEAGGAQCAK
jgi:ribulose-5-phosphate 4-epimerase/fuculose-1-phosphate aldolase